MTFLDLKKNCDFLFESKFKIRLNCKFFRIEFLEIPFTRFHSNFVKEFCKREENGDLKICLMNFERRERQQ